VRSAWDLYGTLSLLILELTDALMPLHAFSEVFFFFSALILVVYFIYKSSWYIFLFYNSALGIFLFYNLEPK
jgi:hypothetical protein